MTPDTWRIHPVTPDLNGECILVEVGPGVLIQARVERVEDRTLSVVTSVGDKHDVTVERVWKRVD